jgi:hypothetical protein
MQKFFFLLLCWVGYIVTFIKVYAEILFFFNCCAGIYKSLCRNSYSGPPSCRQCESKGVNLREKSSWCSKSYMMPETRLGLPLQNIPTPFWRGQGVDLDSMKERKTGREEVCALAVSKIKM